MSGLVLLAGCTGASVPSSSGTPTGSSASIGATATAPAQASSTPSVSSSAPMVSPSASDSAAPAPDPSAPSASGALTVTAKADFASPSGRIWCAVAVDAAWCHFPAGFKGAIPSGDEVCPDEGLDVTGVQVTTKGPEYFCSGDPTAFPVKGQPSVAWHQGTGFPWVTDQNFTLAVLPYGKKLASAGFICLSEKLGVTCASRKTGTGFRIALAGVTEF